MIRSFLRRAGVLALAILLISPTALAQSQNDDPKDDTSPEELEQVAEILVQIEEVRQKYQQKIRNTNDENQIRSYQRQMATEIDQTVKGYDGLTTKRYEEITRAANANAELKQKILSLVDKKRKKEMSR